MELHCLMGRWNSHMTPVAWKRWSSEGLTDLEVALYSGPSLLIPTPRLTCLFDSFMAKQHLERLHQRKEPEPMKKIKSKGCLANSRCAVVGANQCVQIRSHEVAPSVTIRHPRWTEWKPRWSPGSINTMCSVRCSAVTWSSLSVLLFFLLQECPSLHIVLAIGVKSGLALWAQCRCVTGRLSFARQARWGGFPVFENQQ